MANAAPAAVGRRQEELCRFRANLEFGVTPAFTGERGKQAVQELQRFVRFTGFWPIDRPRSASGVLPLERAEGIGEGVQGKGFLEIAQHGHVSGLFLQLVEWIGCDKDDRGTE